MVEILPNWEYVLSNSASPLSGKLIKCSKSLVAISAVFATPLTWVASISGNCFLSLSMRSSSSSVEVLHKMAAIQSHLQASLLIPVLLLVPHLQLFPLVKSWPSQSHLWRLESASSKLLLVLMFWLFSWLMNVLDSFLSGECFLDFQLTLPRSIRGILSMTAMALWNVVVR